MCHVLVIGDNTEIQELCKTTLRNHKVDVVSSLQGAAEVLDITTPDIIFLELPFKDENGREFLRERSWHSAVIVVATKKITEDEEVDLMEEGAAIVLDSPINRRKLAAFTDRLLDIMELDEALQHYSEKLAEATLKLRKARGGPSTTITELT